MASKPKNAGRPKKASGSKNGINKNSAFIHNHDGHIRRQRQRNVKEKQPRNGQEFNAVSIRSNEGVDSRTG